MKFFIVCALIAVASAAPQHFYGGHLAAPVAYGHSFAPAAAIVKAPVYAAPVVKHVAPAATSYQTISQVHVSHPQPLVAAPVVKYAAPVVAAPVVKYAAPVVAAPVVKYAAPAYAAAPVYGSGYGHGYGGYGHGYGGVYGHY
ncbi:cuticle protein 16.5-like isoform X2 [Bradysia coprophila]|uniref:cuticle protein 16.5-like isoform X2 n=1 Tax=Bradysia coprophila TaxID=38358 RepID=UPI00187DABDB|nr:cuticle protein 16.5-like isoform X2 [Bradysia coprophila]